MEFRLTDKLHRWQPTYPHHPAMALLYVVTALILLLCNSASANTDTSKQNDTTEPVCAVPLAGAPSCNTETAPGSSSTTVGTSYHVGNPINVLTGNKYQREIDFKAFASSLSLLRHYNSSLSDYNSGMGYGWRHTYQLRLTRVDGDTLQVVQSDGRLIRFHQIPGTASPAVYRAENRHDGILLNNQRTQWYLNDSRVMSFNGSRLTRMDSGDHRGSLKLDYHRNKLASVRDADGNILSFLYIMPGENLPRYGTDASIQPVNALHTVVLPNGQRIRFQYDQQGNLKTVVYPDGHEIHYAYASAGWPNHLTGRSSKQGSSSLILSTNHSNAPSTRKQAQSQWHYDANGLATQWVDQNSDTGVKITRTIKSDGQSEATAVYADNRIEHYRWTSHKSGLNGQQHSSAVHCDNCPWSRAEAAPDKQKMVKPSATHTASADNTRSQALAQEIWKNLTPQTGSRSFTSQFKQAGSTTTVTIAVDRYAKITDLEIGDKSLVSMARDYATGHVRSCENRYLSTNPSPASFDTTEQSQNSDRSQDNTHGQTQGTAQDQEPTCIEDFFDTLELVQELEALSAGESDTLQSRMRGTPGGSAPRKPEGDPCCTMPAGKTCSDLRDDKQMALLSRCAYGNRSCGPRWKKIQPSSVGLQPEQFNKDGFSASLYYDESDDRYVLAFRGTDGLSPKDWGVNFSQGFGGDDHGQYGQAYELSGLVSHATHGSALEFTGHSLGGGLATIAGLQTKDDTTIFNAASLHPATAAYYGLGKEYENLKQIVNNIATKSDPLTAAQRLTSTGVVESPGLLTTIPNPRKEWIKSRGWEPDTLSYHSIDAVIESINTLLDKHCSYQ